MNAKPENSRGGYGVVLASPWRIRELRRRQAKERDKDMLKRQARMLEEQGKYIGQLLSQIDEWWKWWHHWHEPRGPALCKTEAAPKYDATLVCSAAIWPSAKADKVATATHGIDYSNWDRLDISSDEEVAQEEEEIEEEKEKKNNMV